MKILITGAGGQIGSDLIAALVAESHEIVATDINLPNATQRAGVAWHALDIRNQEQILDLFATHRPDAVFHLAAVLSARGERDPNLTYEVNQSGTYHILEACRRAGVRQMMFPSTIAVYGPGLPDPTPDDVPLHPTTMYGVTKVSGELLCEYYRSRYGMDVRGLRYPGLISASLPGGGTSDYALFMYVDAVRLGHYEAFCRPDTRIPLMYMPDGVRALVELFRAPRQALGRCIYNVAAFSPTAAEIAASVTRALDGRASLTFAPDPARQAILDSWPHALDDGCAHRHWGWKAAYDLERMTVDLIPRIRRLLAERGDVFDHEP